MGVLAYVHQIYLDAEHYKLVKAAYDKNPSGMQRPQYDRALEGVIDSKRILLPGNREVEIDRMIHFSAELKQPTILYGAREAYRPGCGRAAQESRIAGSVEHHWPEPGRGADVHLEDETMRQLETYDMAASAPALLQKAGVKFALYSMARRSPRHTAGRKEGHGCRLSPRTPARADANARRDLRRVRPRGQHRKG